MNKFLVVKLRTDWARKHLLDRVVSDGLRQVPYHGDRIHLQLLQKTDVLVFSVESTRGPFERIDHVCSPRADEWFLFDGVPYSREQEFNAGRWAESLYERYRQGGTERFFEDTLGHFCLAHVEADGRITAFGDFSGLAPLFTYENEHLSAVSNRQMLLARLCSPDGELHFDLQALSWLSGQSNLFGRQTAFRAVELIVPGEYWSLDPRTGSSERRRFRSRFWHPRQDIEGVDYSDAQLDELTDHLLEQSRAIARLPFRSMTMDLTGGMDSRLVLALARRSGLLDRIDHVQTYGPSGDAPEIQVARKLADAVGARFQAQIHHPSEFDLVRTWERLRYHVFRYEGAICPIDGLLNPARHSRLNLSGSGGEIVRKHIKKHRLTNPKSLKEAMDLFQDYQQVMDPLKVQRDSVTESQRAFLRQQIAQKYEEGAALNDIVNLLYVENRMALWAGILLNNISGSIRIYPLVNFKATRLAFLSDSRQRQIDRIHFEAMRRLEPGLVEIPFMNTTWSSALAPYMKRAGLRAPDRPFQTTVPFSIESSLPWSAQFLEQAWPQIFDLFFEIPDSGLFEIVSPRDLKRLRGQLSQVVQSVVKIKQVLSLIEMQLLLTGDMIMQYDGDPESEILLQTNVDGISLSRPETSRRPAPIRTPHREAYRRSMRRDIAPGDRMFSGDREHYFSVTESAMENIFLALEIGGSRRLKRILDFACGHGRVLRGLRAAFPDASIVAADISEDGVRFCSETFGAEPVILPAWPPRFGFEDRFDLVWCGSLLTHLNESDSRSYLDFLTGILAPGGILVCSFHGRHSTNRHGQAEYFICKPSWMMAYLEQKPHIQILSYRERGWDNHQDVLACALRKGPI
ncbi:MAG: methyltransferase domain-containing protein [Deltaproteobacteria bacterium]|nr:methyltransferase domain-containing protein [Deltaproteobacteria bacterium]